MVTSEQKPPLWRQLQSTAATLLAIRSGTSGTAALDRVSGELRPGVQALTFHVLRHLGRAEALRQLLAKRSPPPPADALLCSVLALIWREEGAPYEVFTLVNQAVEAAKRDAATQAQASFINACLRRFLRERDSLVASTDKNPVAVWNHPKWWIDQLKQDWPQAWQDILAFNNRHPPMTLRVNCRQISVANYLAALKDAGLTGHLSGSSAIVLHQAKSVQMLPGFVKGAVSVQDLAAQMAAPLLMSGLAACWMPHALLQVLFEDTLISDGYAVTPTSVNWSKFRLSCSRHCGLWSGQVGGCCTAHALCSRPRVRSRSKSFLRTTLKQC